MQTATAVSNDRQGFHSRGRAAVAGSTTERHKAKSASSSLRSGVHRSAAPRVGSRSTTLLMHFRIVHAMHQVSISNARNKTREKRRSIRCKLTPFPGTSRHESHPEYTTTNNTANISVPKISSKGRATSALVPRNSTCGNVYESISQSASHGFADARDRANRIKTSYRLSYSRYSTVSQVSYCY